MSNLLKVDLYKMFKSKAFYITGLILLIVVGMQTFMDFSMFIDAYHHIGSVASDRYVSLTTHIPGAFSVVAMYLRSILVFCSIFITMFMCSEFSFGTIKNIASKGYHRENIYISKFICGVIATLIYAVLAIATTLILAAAIVGDKIPNYFDIPSQFFPSIFLTLLLIISYISLVLMIASLIRTTGASIGAFFIVNTFATLLLSAADAFFENVVETDFRILKYSLSGCLNTVYGHNISTAFPGEDITRYICVAIGFLAGSSAVGLYFFRKRDL